MSFTSGNSIALFCYTLLLLFFSRCRIIQNTSKDKLGEGYYTSNAFGSTQKVFVTNEEESLQIYPVRKAAKSHILDTSGKGFVTLPQQSNGEILSIFSFRQTTFDIDFLTIPFKFRPSAQGFPSQFNANLNGAVYIGYRTDAYRLQYNKNILGKSYRNINRYGFSFGGFAGLGSTAMNPWVTNDALSIEYDGAVWTKGIAAIIGVNAFTVGVVAGWDDLLDRNKRVWIYQRRAWIGFAFGLNLN